MSKSSKLYPISEFCALASRERLSYLLPLLSACSHEELLSIQASLTQLFYRQFIPELPHDVVVRILSSLNLRDLFACMLVSREWYDVIHSNLCSPLWREQAKRLAPAYSLGIKDSQLKLFCRLTRVFQSRISKPHAFTINQFASNIGPLSCKIFKLIHDADILAIHRLAKVSRYMYRDVVAVWKWEGKEFVFKKDILEDIEIGSYAAPIETNSNIQIHFHYPLLLVVHLYLDVFDLNNVNFVSRMRLPVLTEITGIDCRLNSDNSLDLLAIGYPGFIYILNTSDEAGFVSYAIPDLNLFSLYFLEMPEPSIFMRSEFGLRVFKFTSEPSPINISSLLKPDLSSNALSFEFSKDKLLIAILVHKDDQSDKKLLLFSTNTWNLVLSKTLGLPLFNQYSLLAVGKRYVVILGRRNKLEFIFCDIQLPEAPLRSVLFENISTHREIYSIHYVVALLTNGWLDGEMFDEIELEEERSLPMFLVLSKPIPSSLNILSLRC